NCGKSHGLDFIRCGSGGPRCGCGGVVKPDVVLYEEGLDQAVMNDAVDSIARADLLIIGGTSLNVWPAAGLINCFRGSRTVLINKSAVARDLSAGLLITEPIGQVMAQL
ncbi:MAG: NAD-dependent protein deacylase, partial [Dysosmobacter sp.]|nr:NAD-dependent protein deacylase [Dysosmobacter sp.]